MITLTHAAVVQAMVALASEFPHRLNPKSDDQRRDVIPHGCHYTNENGEHCVAGEVIVRLGGRLPEYGTGQNGIAIDALVRDGYDFGINLPASAFELLSECQLRADRGFPWGTAVAGALF